MELHVRVALTQGGRAAVTCREPREMAGPGGGYVVRQLGRSESGDRRELFTSEEEAMAALRGRLLGTPKRVVSSEERADIRERMQRRAEEVLRCHREGEEGPSS